MKITWYGTACVAVETRETKLLFDPFVPWKGSKAPVSLEDFDGFPRILVTHGHFDHIESLPKILARNPDSVVYCTKTPRRTLVIEGVPKENLRRITAGKQFVVGDILIRTYAGKHAELEIDPADRVLDPRLLKYGYNLPHALYANRHYPENQETLLYELTAGGKRLQIMGSMNLLPEQEYSKGADALILPYVGYRDNLAQAERILARLTPETVILSHFDDTFPPLTREVDTTKIEQREGLRVIRPKYKKALWI